VDVGRGHAITVRDEARKRAEEPLDFAGVHALSLHVVAVALGRAVELDVVPGYGLDCRQRFVERQGAGSGQSQGLADEVRTQESFYCQSRPSRPPRGRSWRLATTAAATPCFQKRLSLGGRVDALGVVRVGICVRGHVEPWFLGGSPGATRSCPLHERAATVRQAARRNVLPG